MGARIPVYDYDRGAHTITVYEETDTGYFRRTIHQPLRPLKQYILDITSSLGQLMSRRYDREFRQWNSPTVTFYLGRPESWYHFIRERLHQRRIVVVTSPVLSARMMKLDVHELVLKRETSPNIIELMIHRYTEALEIWSQAPEVTAAPAAPSGEPQPSAE